ncbi:hypothetical protein [Burkholderia contaminans]|uniref:hypothetical protein n=1 Tax=Burkholderia contaminans TaxID=488447 RepID=UPI0011B26A38|nr:hypothetical protein [Burkholderia contaminans]
MSSFLSATTTASFGSTVSIVTVGLSPLPRRFSLSTAQIASKSFSNVIRLDAGRELVGVHRQRNAFRLARLHVRVLERDLRCRRQNAFDEDRFWCASTPGAASVLSQRPLSTRRSPSMSSVT